MSKNSLLKSIGVMLIIAGVIGVLEVLFHYYGSPFGYGNRDGLMVGLFLPPGLLAIALGITALIVVRFRKLSVKPASRATLQQLETKK